MLLLWPQRLVQRGLGTRAPHRCPAMLMLDHLVTGDEHGQALLHDHTGMSLQQTATRQRGIRPQRQTGARASAGPAQCSRPSLSTGYGPSTPSHFRGGQGTNRVRERFVTWFVGLSTSLWVDFKSPASQIAAEAPQATSASLRRLSRCEALGVPYTCMAYICLCLRQPESRLPALRSSSRVYSLPVQQVRLEMSL